MRRLRGWGTVAAVSVTANVAWFAAARKFPNGPIGRLMTAIRASSRPASTSTPTGG